MPKGDKNYFKALSLAKEKKANNKLVFELLQKAARLNNDKALYAIATWYLFGKFVKKDFGVAVGYLVKASEMGNSSAAFDLAVCYEQGKGIRQDLQEAFKMYVRAALSGDKQSVYEVGRCYYHGIGITENKEIAEVWLENARKNGIR